MKNKNFKFMTPAEQERYLYERRVAAGKKRAESFTSRSQRAARKHLSSEQAAANGRKGALATIERYGHEKLFEACRQKRLHNPSQCELYMIGLLKTLGIKFEREYRLGTSFYTVDFWVESSRLAIEVDGAIHDKGKPGYFKRLDWAKRKDALCASLEITLIRIHHTELGADLSGVIARIREAIGAVEARAA
jgi:very-short-patch-repair endonuclease